MGLYCLSSSTRWKKEETQDYKFTHIDVKEFVLNSFYYRLKYFFLFCIITKDILVYLADIYTLVQYNTSRNFEDTLGLVTLSKEVAITLKVAYLSSIIISLLLLILELYKSYRIVLSRYISTAFTNTISYRQYAVQSFAHYSFFQRIEMYKKPIDKYAFFCFFTLRDYKRIILGQLVRRIIDLYVILNQELECRKALTSAINSRDVSKVSDCFLLHKWSLSMAAKMFTQLVFMYVSLRFIVALILYIPLVMQIRGNLKEYCAHKIDKRIDQLLLNNHRKKTHNLILAGLKPHDDPLLNDLDDPFGKKNQFEKSTKELEQKVPQLPYFAIGKYTTMSSFATLNNNESTCRSINNIPSQRHHTQAFDRHFQIPFSSTLTPPSPSYYRSINNDIPDFSVNSDNETSEKVPLINIIEGNKKTNTSPQKPLNEFTGNQNSDHPESSTYVDPLTPNLIPSVSLHSDKSLGTSLEELWQREKMLMETSGSLISKKS